MVVVKADTIKNAWLKTLSMLNKEGYELPEDGLYRNESLVMEIDNTSLEMEDIFDARFPMTWEEVNYINQHLVNGTNEDKVIHDWTKLYRKRLVTDSHNQLDMIVDYLRNKPQGKRAQASIWNQKEDLYGEIGPCLQILWFTVQDGSLQIHVHMRASDAYGKLLMNVNEFVALQKDIAKKLGVKVGKYTMFVDTCHINENDKDRVLELIKE